MNLDILQILDQLPSDFSPIKPFVYKFINKEVIIDKSETIHMYRNHSFTNGYHISLFKGASEILFQNFYKYTTIEIPSDIISLLKVFNGLYLFDFCIFGLTPSLYSSKNRRLDRTILQPLDLGTANNNWNRKYDRKAFYFGGREYSYTENCGYFIEDNKIRSYLKSGKMIGEWNTINEFIVAELEVLENNINK